MKNQVTVRVLAFLTLFFSALGPVSAQQFDMYADFYVGMSLSDAIQVADDLGTYLVPTDDPSKFEIGQGTGGKTTLSICGHEVYAVTFLKRGMVDLWMDLVSENDATYGSHEIQSQSDTAKLLLWKNGDLFIVGLGFFGAPMSDGKQSNIVGKIYSRNFPVGC